MKVSLLTPTRKRPELMLKMARSALATGNNFEFVFYIDEDDTLSDSGIAQLPAAIVTVVRGPRIPCGQCWQKCFEVSTGDILMMCADDLIFHTPGWNYLVGAEFEVVPDRIMFVFGNDGIQFEALGTHGFVHRRWTEAVGYFTTPHFLSYYNDTWMDRLAKLCGRRKYLPGLNIEHIHPSVGKRPMDETSNALGGGALIDTEQFAKLLPLAQTDAAKLRAAMR